MKTLVMLFVLLCAAVSQAADGSVHGRVYGQDERGGNLGPVAGARIELKSDTGGAGTSVTTNNFGYYQIAALAVGAYRYKVDATGFREENEQRGFVMPQDTREFVHDFILTRESKSKPGPAQTRVLLPAVHGRVYGQTEKGENLGPLPGAKIELLSGKGGTVVATATANSPGGYYEIKALPPADYAYRVSAAGFMTEDAGRGFTVPKNTLEYVHDFILTRPPPKRDRCDLAVLVVKRISTGNAKEDSVRLPVANARLILQPAGNKPTPLNQPFVTDAKGEYTAKDLAEGDYTVAIDAPECEPFTGPLKVVCDKDDQVIFELQPCNELLHGYVRALLNDGWGSSAQAKSAADRAYQRALKADAKDGSVHYAQALAQLSAGDQRAALQSLAAAIAKKQNSSAWDRACEMRVWLSLLQHQPTQTIRELRSLVQNHYADRSATPASKDTAHVCGIALGLIKGPWQQDVGAGDAVLMESELLTALKGELRAECQKARDHVAAEFGKLKAAEDAARSKLMAGVIEKRNAEVERMAERQTAISKDVAVLDADIQRLQGTVDQFDQQLRIQTTGFMQQRQQNAAQMQPMNARLQQISACMAQDQVKYQSAMGQQGIVSPQTTTKPGFRHGMIQPGAGGQAILAEIQQHQAEIQQIRQQMAIIQQQDSVMATNIVNLQNQFQRNAGATQAELNTKSQRRAVLAGEFESLDRQRTAPFDPASISTPEIDDLVRRGRSVKTYRDLPLEGRREELLAQFDCGAAKEPQRPASTTRPVEIIEPAFAAKRPASNLPSATSPSVLRTQPVPKNEVMPPLKPLPASATAVRPPPKAGDPAEIVLTNNHSRAVRIFGLVTGVGREVFVRTLQPGEEAILPATIGQTFVIRAATGDLELQRHQVGKKLEVLKLGGAR